MSREKQLLTYNEWNHHKTKCSISVEVLQASREWLDIFKVFQLKKKNPAHQEYYTKQSYNLKNERDIVAQMSKHWGSLSGHP